MEHIDCIFCHADDSRVVIEDNGYTGLQCRRCGLIYTSPRPEPQDIFDLYGHGAAHISAEAHRAREHTKRRYARHHLKVLQPHAAAGNLLDIGAGSGFFLDEARRLGFEPFAIEFNPTQAEFITHTLGIPCEQKPLSEAMFDGRRFDVIYHCDVISHFHDPIGEFRTIHRMLKPGGVCMFETGNLGEVDRRYFAHFTTFQYPDHLFFFSTDNLRRLLDETGFELVEMRRYSIVPHLRLIKAAMKLMGRGHGKPRSDNAASRSTGSPPSRPSAAARVARRVAAPLLYGLRYGLGGIAPKRGRPQTVLVVARAKPDPSQGGKRADG